MNRTIFFDRVRASLFGGTLSQGQVDGINAILDEWDRRPQLEELRWLAYMLATTLHETNATMQAVKEAYWLSEDWRRVHLRYYPFYGRGLVQLTWQANYEKMTAALQDHFKGIDLVKDPDRALEPAVAVAVLFEGMLREETGVGDFTGRCLEQYFSDEKDDPVGARAIINGTDKAPLIAGYHWHFLEAIVAAEPSQ